MFDLEKRLSLLALKMDGYFGGLHFDNELFYVTSARGVYCVDKKGELNWQNTGLGIDGVTIDKFEDKFILGSGEWDPPGGWRAFKLNKLTGELVG
jgi:hypothetical protein